jgi:iron complex transport system ATP-binding protein
VDPNQAITIDGLSWSYDDRPILTDIAAAVEKQAFTTILGPNGSGKTTLLKQILRILPVRAGTVFLESRDITGLDRRDLAHVIGMVPQNERNPYQFTVEDMIRLGRYAHREHDQQHEGYEARSIERVMKLTSIDHLKDHLITEISGGEYQRVIIARALAQEPRIIALDEPTTYLDPLHQLGILKLLKQLIINEGLTVICILHDLNSAMSFSDHVIMLHDGKVYGHGTPQEMITPQTLKAVYGITTQMVEDPFTRRPYIIPDTNL